ncbi:unnamed protein product [Strongylus vulgaris]|uniref:Uncharacterized protein n=1 Tax=Strongylus vulgaris TaxID=40348 RepID=A0A3P7I8A3_STRVU|nr:unnamed protein product [Strongylus vulgaris]
MHGSQLARNPFYDTNTVAPQKQSNDVFSGMNLSMQAFNTNTAPVKEEQLRTDGCRMICRLLLRQRQLLRDEYGRSMTNKFQAAASSNLLAHPVLAGCQPSQTKTPTEVPSSISS